MTTTLSMYENKFNDGLKAILVKSVEEDTDQYDCRTSFDIIDGRIYLTKNQIKIMDVQTILLKVVTQLLVLM
ncbi:hypothetical protein [Candidatus Ruthturnera calyptogenae]|uniref:hypothetical protein n=1 Tax=Candidatus Ruthturnera calyptogenae TaxID=386487 RepID=UPI0003184B91|nr:hypothetical protein [Candidatus Ruthturnera calyptogenae]